MAMTLRLDDEQMSALRERAKREGRSMQQVAQHAIGVYLARTTRADRVRALSGHYAERYADLLRRLGE